MEQHQSIRKMVDPVGFATKADQMDKVMQRIDECSTKTFQKESLKTSQANEGVTWRVAVCPHDDYTYVGHLYPELLKDIKAKTIILFGVGHKARSLGLENQLIFDSFTQWEAPYGNIKVSSLREDIINELPKDIYQVNDSMQTIEHSVEAIIPFLQYYNKDIEIVSIITPFMSYDRMEQLAKPLGQAIGKAVKKNQWEWGKDYAIVISSDAVHYGDEDWQDRNFAFFGNDEAGYEKAVQHEHTIIDECLRENITPEKIKAFTEFTVEKGNVYEYKWTWCGRFSVPCGLLTSYYLEQYLEAKSLKGVLLSYGTSIDGRKHIPVDDIGMGVTAPAKLRHWVGYASIGYE